jgi:N-methylhydantoinase A
VLCAEGDLMADFREEFSRTFIRTIDSVESGEIGKILEELGAEAIAWLEREGVQESRRRLSFNVDLRYYRQGYEIPVEVELAELAGNGTALLVKRFNDLHEQYYGFRMEGTACEIVNLRAVGVGKVPEPRFKEEQKLAGADARATPWSRSTRSMIKGKWVPTKVYDRAKLSAGNRVPGPAVITEFDSTTVVLSGYTAEIDRFSNILINPNHREG